MDWGLAFIWSINYTTLSADTQSIRSLAGGCFAYFPE